MAGAGRCAQRALQRRLFSRGASDLRVCIVGSGPAGFYTAHRLVKCQPAVHVDIVEQLPVPFGLIRFGAAPDHSQIKNCANLFTNLARTEACRFIGNITVGRDVSYSQLRPFYHAVVLAYGVGDDHVLGVPGEDLPGVCSARAFVGWYNGLPAHKDLNPDLSGETAIVIGQGNVALDVARILLTPPDLLQHTDICSHALKALQQSGVRRVYTVGRRGPLQVAFTIKELRQMTKLPGCSSRLLAGEFEGIPELVPSLPTPRKRLVEFMLKTAAATRKHQAEEEGGGVGEKEWHLRFLRSPVEFIASAETGRLEAIKLEVNKLEGDGASSRAVGTGEMELVSCSLALRSIGYKPLPIDPDLPFDSDLGIVPNVAGRVTNGLYCSGWVKTGPAGVILNTIDNAFETAESIVEDFGRGVLPHPSGDSVDDVIEMLTSQQGVKPTSFMDWERIDEEERQAGSGCGKPREKILSVQRMLEIIRKSS